MCVCVCLEYYLLLQSSQKISLLEQSLQESSNDKTQSAIAKQLASLKKVKCILFDCMYYISLYINVQKMKQQEDQLHSHRQELSVLQSRETTPVSTVYSVHVSHCPLQTPPPTSPVRVLESPPVQRE